MELSRKQIWEHIKPLREAGMTNIQITKRLGKLDLRFERGGKIWPADVSHITLTYGGEKYRRRGNGGVSAAEKMEVSSAEATVTPTAEVLGAEPRLMTSTMRDIVEVFQSNLGQSLKTRLVQQLSSQL